MARKLDPRATLDTLEDEVMFTHAMLKADEDAQDLAAGAADWLSWIDAVRASDRAYRQLVADTDAGRISANQRLDVAVTRFADDLLLDCGKDRKSTRWLGFFPQAPNLFVKQPLADEAAAVRGWLDAAQDSLVEEHREELSKREGNASSALAATRTLSSRRSTNLQQREELAKRLTDARDALHSRLQDRARERNLPRDWADAFFRVEEPKPAASASSTVNGS